MKATRSFRILLMTATALWMMAIAAISAFAATTSYTMVSDVRVPMSDGILLDTDQYIPTSGCPCPTILIQTPYRKSGSAVGEANTVFPSSGYAMIVSDVRGTGLSEGMWDSFGAAEQSDGATMVKYAASQPFSNGVVGLAGVSYSAINQFLTVEQPGTSAVKAIFPIVPMSDAYRDVTWAGGNVDAGFIPLWLGLVNVLAVMPAQDATSQPQIALNTETMHAIDIGEFSGMILLDAALGGYEMMLPSALQTYPNDAYDGSFSQLRSPIRKISQVNIPTFIVGGTYDIFQRGEPILFNALNLKRGQKKLLIGPWYHTTAGNGLTADDGSSPIYDTKGTLIPSLNNLQLAWFDHWLKGVKNGIDKFPQVETYYLGANKWVPDTTYPASRSRYQRWYLSATKGSGTSPLFAGSLEAKADATETTVTMPWTPLNGACSRSTTQWTAGIVSGTQCESSNGPTEALGATFTTTPFSKPYALSGPINSTIWVSSTAADTSLIATISDVAADGTSSQITSGSIVASLAALTKTSCGTAVVDCSVYKAGQIIQPWHPYTQASQVELQPNVPTQVQIEVFPTTAVIEPGHSLRLTITTADFPHEAGTISTETNSPGIDTLYLGREHPSSIYVKSHTIADQLILRDKKSGGHRARRFRH